MSEDREAFLARWSRRKLETREASAKPAVPQAPEAAPGAPSEEAGPAPALPPVDSLTPESDFRPFMGANVEPQTRRAALKKLFADAHFNVPDPYEAYSEDYTKAETIPLEMLRTLNQAKAFLFDETTQAAPPQSAERAAEPAPAAAATQSDGSPGAAGDHVADKQDA